MKKTVYYKLVRDRIPEIIEQAGQVCSCSVLSDEDYLKMLDEKLNEELADLLEVVRAVTIARGSSPEEVEEIRRQKEEKRGGFAKKILLEEVTEP